MRPEASILSARCEIREIPLTVEYSTTETDSTAVSFVAEQLSARVGPARRVLDVSAVRVTRPTGVRGFPLTALYTCDRAARRGGGRRGAAPRRAGRARPPAGRDSARSGHSRSTTTAPSTPHRKSHP